MLSEADAERVELRLLGDGGYFEELEIVENELVDEHARGELPAGERADFEGHFLAAPERQRKLAFARALAAESSAPAAESAATNAAPGAAVLPLDAARRGVNARPVFSSIYFKVAAALVLVAGLGLVLRALFAGRSEADQALAALGEAYRGERLVESRVSGVEHHAPFRRLRGDDRPDIDQASLDLAERQLLEAVKKRPDDARARHALGRIYLAGRKPERAEEQFDMALASGLQDARLYSDSGAALLELGGAEGDAGKAAEHFGRSLERLNRALELDPSLPEALFNRALLYQHLALPAQAREAWRKYLERDPSSAWADEARRNLRTLEEQSRRDARPVEQYYEAFVAARAAGDAAAARRALARAHVRAGNRIAERLLDEHLDLSAQGRGPEAADKLELLAYAGRVEEQSAGDRYIADLAAVYEKADDARRLALSRARGAARLARDAYDRSELKPAAEAYAEAARLFGQAGDECEALAAESWIGYCELRIPEAAAARRRFERLSERFEALGYRSLLAQSLHALSDAATSFDEMSRALDYAGRAAALAEQIGDDETRLRCLQQFVSMHLGFGNHRESLKQFREGVELARALPPQPRLVWPFYHQAALNYLGLDLPDAALEYGREALRLAEESQWPLIVARSHAQIGTIHERRGDHAAAIRSGLRALAEGEKVRDEKSRLNILSHASLRLAHVYRGSGDAASALAHYEEAGRIFERRGLGIYLYESHRGRFLAHNDRNDLARAAEELELALRYFDRYRGKILEESNRNSFFDANQDIYDLATDFALTRLGDRERAFDYAEAARARSLLSLLDSAPQLVDAAGGRAPDIRHAEPAAPLPLAQIRAALPADVQLLQYSLLADKLVVWLVARDRFETEIVPVSAPELKRKVETYLRRLAQPGGEGASDLGAELHETLVAPVESRLSAGGLLCIVPEKVLSHLPYASLVSRDGRFFVARHRFVVSPSANVFLRATEAGRAKRGAAPGGRAGGERMLSVGNPAFARAEYAGLADLPAAGREAALVAARYGASALTGAGASETRVREAMPEADVVHLATHYVADERSPMLSRLLLSGAGRAGGGATREADGALEAFEVYGMRLRRTRLVVLSACRTGVEQSLGGEGAIGIARSFLSAGAPLVVASLWPVESDATAALMIRFHERRTRDGLDTAEALRQAQLEMIGDPDEARRHPHAWAAFVAFGGRADF